MAATREFLTANSVYIVDDANRRYMRLPRADVPRQPNDSWRLQDHLWLPLREYRVEQQGGVRVLRLFTPDAVNGVVTSPIEQEI